MEVRHLLLWSPREDIEEVADDLNAIFVPWIPLEIGLLELAVRQTVEVIDCLSISLLSIDCGPFKLLLCCSSRF